MGGYNNDRYRGGFGRRSFGNGGDGFRDRGRDEARSNLHWAVCANCGKDCQVPFRPTGEKPVYCSDCFEKMSEGGNDSRDSYRDRSRSDYSDSRSSERPERSDRSDYRSERKQSNTQVYIPEPKPAISQQDFKDLVARVNSLSSKLDRILLTLEVNKALGKNAETSEVPAGAIVASEDTKPAAEAESKAKAKKSATKEKSTKKKASKKKAVAE